MEDMLQRSKSDPAGSGVKKWHHHSLSNSTAATSFPSAEMHSDTTNGSCSVKWKETVVSHLTQILLFSRALEKKSYFEGL